MQLSYFHLFLPLPYQGRGPGLGERGKSLGIRYKHDELKSPVLGQTQYLMKNADLFALQFQ